MSTYDEVIEQNKRYLTQAQIASLANAAQQYSLENAGNRAGALASARQQYDTGYRGLQNMGLAGANGAQPTSGEVPRLKTEIQTPFDQYNQRLKDVERQRVASLSGNMVYQNQLAAAQAQAQAEAQRAQADAIKRAKAAAAALNKNGGIELSEDVEHNLSPLTPAQRQAVDAATAANERGEKLTQQIKQSMYDDAQQRGMARTARPQDIAAANAFANINTTIKQQNAAFEQATDASKKAYEDADRALKNLQLQQHYGGKVADDQLQAAKRTRDEAKQQYETAEAKRTMDQLKQTDPDAYGAYVTLSNPYATQKQKAQASQTLGSRAADQTVAAMGIQKTMTDADYDKLSKVVPDVRRALNVIDSQRQVQEQKKKTGTTGADYEQRDIDEQLAELKKLGYTEEEARQLLKSYDDERQVKMEYSYWQPAYSALYAHQGEKPTGKVNEQEADAMYRAINGLEDIEQKAKTSVTSNIYNIGVAGMSALTSQQRASFDTVWYMTDEQKDAYNAIYEKEGLKAANEYAKAIKPLLDMQRAEDDQKFLEEMATDESFGKRFEAWLLARTTNLVGSVPAMLEKLAVGGINAANYIASGGTNTPKKYSYDSDLSRFSNWADIVQSSQAQQILENHDKKVFKNKDLTWGQVLSFGYQTGTSMADSIIAMGLSSALGEVATYALFFSSAGNQAYKDTIARGGTQGQAMAMSILSGAAEAVFEEVSLEQLTKTLKFGGKPFAQIVKQALVQAGVEGSEEFFTSVANMLSDMMVMGDKAEIDQAIKNNSLGKYLWDNLGMDAIGGFVSGLGFGAASMAGYGASKGINAVVDYKNKKALGGAVRENTAKMQEIKNTAILLGGETAGTVQAVDKKATNTNVGDMTVAVAQDLNALEEKGNDQKAATLQLIEGEHMDLQQAGDVLELLGAEELSKRGYDTSSAEAFQKSYNDRVAANDITNRTTLQQQSQRKAAAERVWANPEQGLALTNEDGRTVRPMPGNMTAVAKAEQERTGFKTRTTATNGKVTYAISGMEARQGMTNEQIYQEIQNGLTKEARQKAQRYEKLANALGLKMVIHDVMTGTNGFIDSDGNMHVVLSGRQTVLRVASHELTHHMKEHNATEYASLRDHLIKEVGQEKFDDMVKKKAKQYGLDLNTEKGKIEADDEVCAELCERMLSSEEAIERFAEKDTAAAKTLKDRLMKILNAIRAAVKDERFGRNSELIKDQETIETWIAGVAKAIENAEARAKTNEGIIGHVAGTTIADQEEMIDEIKKAKTDADVDAAIDRACVDVIEYDMPGYKSDLLASGVMSETEVDDLFDLMTKVVDQVKLHRAILDFGPMLSEEAQNDPELAAKEIKEMKQGRAYLPYKQNADPHYKLALDFSTLCRKRILLQTIQERLQAKLGRALSQEETVAIRLELQNLQKNNKEEFGKIEVACALCYVEAARLKSPKVINAFLNNTKAEMQNYFAKKNPATKEIIEGKQQEWKVEHGYAPDATKKQMSAKDAAEFSNKSREWREQFDKGPEAEKAVIARAVALANNERVQIGGIEFRGRETFLSASWLEKLKGVEPDIFYAFTDKVRSATRSKAQETDTFYARRDIDMVTEGILGYANAESGFRHQSWSDFVTIHLLDTMASVIEMSTRQAKMHAYTKVPAMVRFLGKTGMMLNMSLIPAGQTGLRLDGTLDFDSVEGMAWETMKELRDMFPDTAGNIAIGINDAQIRALLESPDIDYVIPYHASGMNKNMRGYMDIKSWAEYTSSQNEKSNHRGAKGKSPELAEWFDEKKAAKAEDGYTFMRAASEKYLQLCAERNLIPKFSQYLTNNGDGSYSLKEGYENYWKLLIDRKMVNQVTGKVILQQVVKPTFDQDTVLSLLEDRITDPTVQQQAKAADLVTEKFGDWQANKNNASAEAIAESKKIRDRSNAITAQKTAEGTRFDLDTDLETAESNIRYSLADEELSSALDNEEMVPVYRAMQVIDGKLYPPMAAKVAEEAGGKRQLVEPTEIGKWYVSDERPDLIDPKTGRWKLDKANGSAIEAAYNPYFHTSLSPLNDQFSSAYNRPNLVVVEGYVPKSELTSGYKAQYAKDSVGAMRWHSGPVSSHLSTPRTVILSRYFKANRILSDAEVARNIARLVEGENVSIPQNTVTPGLYAELQKLGVPTTSRYDLDIDEEESPRSLAEQITRYSLDEEPKQRKPRKAQKQEEQPKEPKHKSAGKGPRAREVNVPDIAANGKRVSDFTRSFLESNKATDEIASEMLSKVESGEWGGYTRLTNDEAMERAKNYIAKRQVVAAQQDFHDMVMSGKYNVNTRALGLQLLTEAAQRGDKVAVLDIASDLRVLATDAGQSVQIFSVLKDLGGVGSAWYLNKVVERLNTKYADQIADGKMNEITVPEDLMAQLEQAQTTQDVTAAERAIAKNIADQLPLTWADRLSNWRYLAMLGNPTTHVRNLFGNLLMGGMNTAKDAVAAGIERIGVKDQNQRTHAVLTAADRKAWNGFAEQAYKDNEGLLRGNGKFSFESEIKQNMRSFDTKALNAVAQFNFNALENEDMWFIRPAFKNALMQYLKAQGYTIQDGVAGKMVNGEFKAMTKAQTAQAVEYASEQAWKATFHDASALASMLNKISNMNTASRLIVEGVMPFKKTPINIAKRGVEYSPAGIVMGTIQLARDVRKGKVTTAHAIDNLASGITGTALMALGMFLAKAGLVKAEGDDDKKKATYQQDTGDQTYSLKIGKYSISLSALAPATIPLFMGAALQEKISGTGDLDLSTITDVISGTLNPFMEMSFMSSLNSALKNYGSEGIGGALGNSLLTSAENYFSQYLPTVTGKVGQFLDPTARTTKSSAASKIGSGLDYYARSLVKKVPGAESLLEPDVNVWGRETKKDSFQKWALDFANKFILPVNVKVSNRDAVDDELIRLVESTGETDMLPSDGPKYFTVKGEKYSMTAAQYTEYSKERGTASYAALKSVMSSDAYMAADDEQKANMLQNALEAAQKQVNTVWKEKLGAYDTTQKVENPTSVKEIQGDYSDPDLYNVAAKYGQTAYDKAAKAKSQGVSPDAFTSLYEYYDTYTGDDRAADTRKAIMDSDLTVKQKELMDDLIVSSGKNTDYSSQALFDLSMINKKTYDKAKTGEKMGIKPETYLAAYNKDKEIDAAKLGKEKKSTVVKYVESLHLSAAAEDYLLANIFGYTTR